MSSLVGFFSKDASDDNDTPVKETEVVDDYMGEDDEKSIMQEINLNIKSSLAEQCSQADLHLYQ